MGCWPGGEAVGLGFGHGALGTPRTHQLHRSEVLQSDLGLGTLCTSLAGEVTVPRERAVPCRRLAQSTKSPPNSKRQESMNTETDISPVNPSQENNFNPCLRLGLKFA